MFLFRRKYERTIRNKSIDNVREIPFELFISSFVRQIKTLNQQTIKTHAKNNKIHAIDYLIT